MSDLWELLIGIPIGILIIYGFNRLESWRRNRLKNRRK